MKNQKNNSLKKLLIIEDDKLFSELIAKKFVKEGFEVQEADSAEKGIKLAKKNHPDLVLLDIVLPKMDGITMLSLLRKDSWGKGVPVIVLSSINDQQKVSQAMRLGIYDYLVKSNFILNDLVKQIKEVLRS